MDSITKIRHHPLNTFNLVFVIFMFKKNQSKNTDDLQTGSYFTTDDATMLTNFNKLNKAFFNTVQRLNSLLESEDFIQQAEIPSNFDKLSTYKKIKIINTFDISYKTSQLLNTNRIAVYGYYLRQDLIKQHAEIRNYIGRGTSDHPYYTAVIRPEFETLLKRSETFDKAIIKKQSNSFEAGLEYGKDLLNVRSLHEQKERQLLYFLVFPSVCAIFGLMFIMSSYSNFNFADSFTNTFSYIAITISFVFLAIATLIYSLGTRLNLIFHYVMILSFVVFGTFLTPEANNSLSMNLIFGLTLILFTMNHSRHYFQYALLYKRIKNDSPKMILIATQQTEQI